MPVLAHCLQAAAWHKPIAIPGAQAVQPSHNQLGTARRLNQEKRSSSAELLLPPPVPADAGLS